MKKLILLYFTTIHLFATDYAIIITIGNYKDVAIPELKNYKIDIKNYNEILYNYRVDAKNIYRLINHNATKDNIKNRLSYIASKIKKNDRFFMFFSGHGTSLFDENYSEALQEAKLINLMMNSGAILPYNFNPKDISNTIIIGKRDLKPYLQKIDKKGVKVLVVFDACFAENSIRNENNRLVNRTPNILTDSKNYPYKNIVYIASSIIQSQSGKFSPILKSCLNNMSIELKLLKECINKKIGNTIQIPAILCNSNRTTLF